MTFNGLLQNWNIVPLQYKRWALQAIALLLIFLGCVYLYQAFKPLHPLNQTPAPLKSTATKTLNNKSALFSKPIFGIYQPLINDKDIKQSMLSLQIVGIMYSEYAPDSQVVIKAADGDEQTYIIDDTLPGGAVIKKISANGIVVLYNGELQRLTLPKNELIFAAPAKPLE